MRVFGYKSFCHSVIINTKLLGICAVIRIGKLDIKLKLAQLILLRNILLLVWSKIEVHKL